MKSAKRRPAAGTGLMIVSQCVLAVFLVFWLLSQYRGEKRDLRDNLLAKLSAAQTKATDSSVLEMLIKPLLQHGLRTESQARVRIEFNDQPAPPFPDLGLQQNRERHTMSVVHRMDSFRLDSFVSYGSGDSTVRQHIQHQIDSAGAAHISDTGKALIKEGVELIIGKTATLADSTQMMILKGDTGTMRRYLQQSLNESGMNFRLYWVRGAGTDSAANLYPGLRSNASGLLAGTGTDLMLPVGYVMNEDHDFLGVAGYRPYLLRRLWPQAFFALVLLGITGAAFLLAARSLRQQRRLALMREELVGNMSHELKTPVATVKVALEALGDEEVLADRGTVRDYLGMASAEVTRLELLINQTLHTSLLEQGRMRIHPAPLDLLQLVETVVRSVRLRAEDAVITLEAAGADWTASGDALHLQGVMLNLLDNALKYAGSRSRITVSLKEYAASFSIIVADDGLGIPEAYLNKVFDKFFRVPTANRHDVKGYGLGLSYAVQVVRQHAGSISAGNAPSGGAVFTIILPRQSAGL